MRLKISLKAPKNDYLIPYNYNHILSAIIYRKIADLDLASQLHASQDFKHFTFSMLIKYAIRFLSVCKVCGTGWFCHSCISSKQKPE